MTASRFDNSRPIAAPHGPERTAKSWQTEAPLRMLMNNLDPEVAERPGELVVYGGIGRAARDWESFDRIVASLRKLEADQTLLVQSGKPVGIFRTTIRGRPSSRSSRISQSASTVTPSTKTPRRCGTRSRQM